MQLFELVKRIFCDKRSLVLLLLLLLVIFKGPQVNARFVLWIFGGVSFCGLLDFLINKMFFYKKVIPKSAVITGFILAGILDYHQEWFVLLFFSMIAIASKYLIKLKKKHIFNPANFALFCAALLKQPLSWNIESNVYLIILAGFYFSISLKKWPHVLGFLSTFSILFYISGVNPFNLISFFFVFVMLIEPKTSVFGIWKGLSFGCVAGLASFVMFKFFPQIDMLVSSLIVANGFNCLVIKK